MIAFLLLHTARSLCSCGEIRRLNSGITGRRDSVWFVAFTEQPTCKLLTLSGSSCVQMCPDSEGTRSRSEEQSKALLEDVA
jgi:hypothetical protein